MDPKSKIELLKNIPQYEQRSVEWFNQRKDKLTSSDAATALGLNPYQKPVELLFKKCGVETPFIENVATLHGQKYEDEAINQYCKAMGKINHDFGLIEFDAVHRPNDKHSNNKYPKGTLYWMAGSTDGIAEDVDKKENLIVLEVKCPYRRTIVHGMCPEYYYPQVQLNMAILDIDKADFIEYNPRLKGTLELNIVRIQRCNRWFDKNVPILESFWKSVEYWRENDITKHPEYEGFVESLKPKPKKVLDLRDNLSSNNLQVDFLESEDEDTETKKEIVKISKNRVNNNSIEFLDSD